MPPCECGCGLPTPLARRTDRRYGHIKNQPIRFIPGHQSRMQSADRCRQCGKPVPAIARQHADPYCSTLCAKLAHHQITTEEVTESRRRTMHTEGATWITRRRTE